MKTAIKEFSLLTDSVLSLSEQNSSDSGASLDGGLGGKN
jgi:hypothetical protein